MFKQVTGRLGPTFPRLKGLRHSLLLLILLWVQFSPVTNAQASGYRSSFIGPSSEQTPKSAEAQVTPEVVALEAGKSIEREISGGQTQRYHITASAGQFLAVMVQQRGVDIAVGLLGTDNKLIAVFDGEMRSQGKEQVEFVAETAGAYTLSIRAKFKGLPAGAYEIGITETRPATDDDRSLQEARKLRAQAGNLYRAGKYNEALPLMEQATVIAEKVLGADHVYVAWLVREQADAHQSKLDHGKAKTMYERALVALEKDLGQENPLTAETMRALGSTYMTIGDYVKAEQLLQRALQIQEKTLGPDHPWVADCLRSLGVLYTDRGDLENAEVSYRRALAIAEKNMGTQDFSYGQLLNNLGLIYLHKEDYDQAEPFFQRALTVEEKAIGPQHYLLAPVLQNLGIIAREKKDYVRAEEYYRRALSIREKALGPEHPDVGANLINIANLYGAKGDYPKSLEIHLRALAILEKNAGPGQWTTVVSLGNIARTYAVLGDLPSAIKFESRMDAAIENDIEMNLAIGSEREKLDYLDTVSERTDRTLSLSLQLTHNEPDANALAVLALLQRKGRVLDAMTDTLTTVRQHSDKQDHALLDQLDETTTQLARRAISGPQRTAPEEYHKTIKDLEEKKEQLEAEISRHNAEFRARSQPVTLEAVRAALPENVALVEFATYHPFDPRAVGNAEGYGETRYAVYVLRKQGAVKGKDLGEAKAIDVAVDALRAALRDPSRRDARELARSLDEKVMRPVRALVGDATQLLVSPDGPLNLIPFAALVDEQGRYLIQRYSLSYLTSGRDLLRMQVARESRSQPLVIANPLFGEPATELLVKISSAAKPTTRRNGRRSVTSGRDLSEVYFAPLGGTAEEAHSIQTLFPDANILTGAQATESAIKQTAAPRILHIATHGFFLQDKPAGWPDALVATAGSNPKTQATAGSVNKQAPTRAISATTRIENPLLRSGLALAGANLARRR